MKPSISQLICSSNFIKTIRSLYCFLMKKPVLARPLPLNYKQVRVKAPPYSHATYHDIVDLSPCLSSVGLEIQEKINLTKEQGGSRVHSSVYRHASSSSGASALFGGDRRSERWKEGRAGGAREATASCTVNLTTTYVPHTVRAICIITYFVYEYVYILSALLLQLLPFRISAPG